jgi:hypothetical protein
VQRAVKGREQLVFVGAAEDYAAHPGNTQSIETMMQLAMEAVCLSIQRRARDWLFMFVNVKIVDEGGQYATEAAPACLR